ncbi:DUF7573 domain-containing protein [Halomarina rubra]|uniref:DUF7573 domain-containing protein n=1 Tax=Halomarina rubra TaxID=2071873 RepID=A0ABD6AQ88_9EURY|nr:hypothetical protein [Halomarina rubra]
MDRSLDEFLASDEGDEDDEDEGEGESVDGDGHTDADATADAATDADATTESDDASPSLTVHPAESTMDWTPGGAACAVCGESAERRWRDDEGLVCLDCKTW